MSLRPDDFEDSVSVSQLVGLDVGVGQGSPQIPHRVLAAQVRHDARQGPGVLAELGSKLNTHLWPRKTGASSNKRPCKEFMGNTMNLPKITRSQ